MGTCVSVHRDHPDSATTMKLHNPFGSKQPDNKLLIPSPTKVKNTNNKPIINGIARWPLSQSPPPFPHFGSKDEAFFDSQAWLESDCEDDDFMSVRGDFTPSRGSTPVHHNFSTGTPRVNGLLLVERTTPVSLSEPSPNTQKKRLSDLFKDSLRDNHDADDDDDKQSTLSNQNEANGKLGTPYTSKANSVSSDGRTPQNGDFKPVREKSMKSVQCCLPNMLSTRSYSERKKKMSPAHGIG